MGDAAIALAILGVAVGIVFRLQVLVLVLALLLAASIILSVTWGFGFLKTALIIMAVQGIVQGSYFLGLVVRAALAGTQRTRPIL
jgi:hypothetical protein